MSFSVKGVSVVLEGGIKMAAGCICREEAAEECLKKLELLKGYTPRAKDLVGIDMELANTICGLFHKGNGESPVIAAGASIHLDDADVPGGMTTGGILGDPNEEIASSDDESEPLRDGFNLMTLSGSPGLCANADRGTVNTVLFLIKKLKDQGRLNDELLLNELFDSFKITNALLVIDGTGSGMSTFVACKDGDKTEIYC